MLASNKYRCQTIENTIFGIYMVYSLDIGYGIRIIGLPYGFRFKATSWETDEWINALENTTFPEQFMLATDVVYVRVKGDVTIPLDASLFLESIAVEVILPSINDFDTTFFQYKAGVRFQNRWNFFDIVVLACNAHHNKLKGIFRTDKIESLCIFVQAIKEKREVSVHKTKYVNAKDKQIQVKFPQNSVTISEQIDFKIGGQKADDGNFDYFVFKVKDDLSIELVDTKPEINDGIASFTVSSFSG
ncbi:Hypothetical predicted protein [Mytilus galloprovincialis]|uniref:Uncharacterized protein n=1 Tax=Mytilus galloprovincialis TaxID=29158 RepID=A0A8B6CPK2_MYTGA|nr:Hypothetical predicted protein [Mytilus galloprovincialis]